MVCEKKPELDGVEAEPAEVERLTRRLNALRRSLTELEPWISPEVEPLPTVELEGF